MLLLEKSMSVQDIETLAKRQIKSYTPPSDYIVNVFQRSSEVVEEFLTRGLSSSVHGKTQFDCITHPTVPVQKKLM
jgi:hypothetical protein